MKKETRNKKFIAHSSYLLNHIVKRFFFWFLVIFLLILIYGTFQQNSGFGFFVPYWEKLSLLLGLVIFFGILAVLIKEK